MTKLWIRWSLVLLAVTVTATAGFACERNRQAADAKDATKVAAAGDAKGCDMPCCAHANGAEVAKTEAPAPAAKPCAGHDPKGCPRKATSLAKLDPAKESPKAELAAVAGPER